MARVPGPAGVLRKQGSSRVSRLAHALMLSKQTTSQTADELVRANLVTRGVRIPKTTDAGIARLQVYEGHFDEYLEGLLEALEESETAHVTSALRQLNAETSTKRDAGHFRPARQQSHG